MNTDLIVPETTEMTGFEMKPKTLAEAMRFCEIMADSDLVPKDYKGKPGNIMVAIQLGAELGLTPMRALKSIAVINGRPSMWGDEMLAMVLASPLCEYIDESESTPKEGVCKIKRKGHPEYISRFSLEDARRAGLIGKQGPWTLYEGRMLKLRARGFGIRDKFADKLANLITTEEAMDMPVVATVETQVGSPPSSLKDKLKTKLLEERLVEQDGAGHAGAEEAHKAGVPQQARDAAPPFNEQDSLLVDLQQALRQASTSQDVNKIWSAMKDEDVKRQCYDVYRDALKALKGR